LTKDLITGVWVGADDRSVHFNSSQTGEGSRTALPIFAKFMEKVYRDPSTGITQGPFPKSDVEITRSYDCPSPRIVVDTLSQDSLSVDSLNTPILEINPDELENEIKPAGEANPIKKEKANSNQSTTPVKQNDKNDSNPQKEELTKQEERRLKRQNKKNNN